MDGSNNIIESTAANDSWKLTSKSERGEKIIIAMAAKARALSDEPSRRAQRPSEKRVKSIAALTIDGERPATNANPQIIEIIRISRRIVYARRLRHAGSNVESII